MKKKFTTKLWGERFWKVIGLMPLRNFLYSKQNQHIKKKVSMLKKFYLFLLKNIHKYILCTDLIICFPSWNWLLTFNLSQEKLSSPISLDSSNVLFGHSPICSSSLTISLVQPLPLQGHIWLTAHHVHINILFWHSKDFN